MCFPPAETSTAITTHVTATAAAAARPHGVTCARDYHRVVCPLQRCYGGGGTRTASMTRALADMCCLPIYARTAIYTIYYYNILYASSWYRRMMKKILKEKK